MTITAYVDLGSPLSYLVYQRVRRLRAAGIATVRVRPVVPDGVRRSGGSGDRELIGLSAQAVEFALPGETRPATPPARSHPGAMTAAYAEARTEGFGDSLLDAFMTALWRDGRVLSDPASVRGCITAVAGPPASDVRARRWLATPVVPLGAADPSVLMRRCGGTITPAGAPVSTAGYRRMTAWQEGWVRRGRPALPLVQSPLGEAFAGAAGLDYLARLLPAGPREIVTGHAALRHRLTGAVAGLAVAASTDDAFGESRRALLAVLRSDLVRRIGDEDRRFLAVDPAQDAAAALRRDHERIRAGVRALELATGKAAALTVARDLLTQLDRHLRREDELLPRLAATAAGRAVGDHDDRTGEPAS